YAESALEQYLARLRGRATPALRVGATTHAPAGAEAPNTDRGVGRRAVTGPRLRRLRRTPETPPCPTPAPSWRADRRLRRIGAVAFRSASWFPVRWASVPSSHRGRGGTHAPENPTLGQSSP